MPRSQVRADRAYPDPLADLVADAARHGDWPTVGRTLQSVEADRHHRYRLVTVAAGIAENDDRFLQAWLAAMPDDPTALTLHGASLTNLAFTIRTASSASAVSPEQWRAFRRLLEQAEAPLLRAAQLAPSDPTPWAAHLHTGLGLSYDHDRFRALFAGAVARAPYFVPAYTQAFTYWQPRWKGSDELLDAFVDSSIASAPPGSLLTVLAARRLFSERMPPSAERAAWFRGPEVADLIDRMRADLAAARPDHAFRSSVHHWLAYWLTKAGRWAEAVAEFRAIGGYAGAVPWVLFDDEVKAFSETRAAAVIGWEDANPGR